MTFYISQQGIIFSGDPLYGDREATPEEVDEYLLALNSCETASSVKAALQELDIRSIRTLHKAVLELIKGGASLPAEIANRLVLIEEQKEELRKQL